MGLYLRFIRPGKTLEGSVLGVLLLIAAVWGGQWIHSHPTLAEAFTFKAEPLAWAIVVYGFAASVLPVWLLLAPRDYLSTFMKLGISPGIHLFGVKETWFISWGLQQIDVDEETPRSTRLNVDSHF